jgi:DNA polymerase delta subunit 1
LERLFEPIIDNPSSLLQGDHTRVVVRKTPTARKGTITGFAKVKATCLGCKTPMPEGKGSLCQFCIPKEAQIYAAAQSEVNTQQVMYSRLWTQCQSCQGSFHQDVICSNQDCPIFYKRKKVQLDLRDAMKRLDKLAW